MEQPAFTEYACRLGSAVMVLQSEDCRAKARECEDRASSADDPGEKKFWLALAQQWHQLALQAIALDGSAMEVELKASYATEAMRHPSEVAQRLENCRTKAQECENRASSTDNPGDKKFWVVVAQNWHRRAVTLEGNGAR
jgi:hypothetical protein